MALGPWDRTPWVAMTIKSHERVRRYKEASVVLKGYIGGGDESLGIPFQQAGGPLGRWLHCGPPEGTCQ